MSKKTRNYRSDERGGVNMTAAIIMTALVVSAGAIGAMALNTSLKQEAQSGAEVETASVEALAGDRLRVTPVIGDSVDMEHAEVRITLPDGKQVTFTDAAEAVEHSATKRETVEVEVPAGEQRVPVYETKEVPVNQLKRVGSTIEKQKPQYRYTKVVTKRDPVFTWERDYTEVTATKVAPQKPTNAQQAGEWVRAGVDHTERYISHYKTKRYVSHYKTKRYVSHYERTRRVAGYRATYTRSCYSFGCFRIPTGRQPVYKYDRDPVWKTKRVPVHETKRVPVKKTRTYYKWEQKVTKTERTTGKTSPGENWKKAGVDHHDTYEVTKERKAVQNPGEGWTRVEQVGTKTVPVTVGEEGDEDGDGWKWVQTDTKEVRYISHYRTEETTTEVETTLTTYEWKDDPSDRSDSDDRGDSAGILASVPIIGTAEASSGPAASASNGDVTTVVSGVGGNINDGTATSWENGESFVVDFEDDVLDEGDVVRVQVIDTRGGSMVMDKRARLTNIPPVSVGGAAPPSSGTTSPPAGPTSPPAPTGPTGPSGPSAPDTTSPSSSSPPANTGDSSGPPASSGGGSNGGTGSGSAPTSPPPAASAPDSTAPNWDAITCSFCSSPTGGTDDTDSSAASVPTIQTVSESRTVRDSSAGEIEEVYTTGQGPDVVVYASDTNVKAGAGKNGEGLSNDNYDSSTDHAAGVAGGFAGIGDGIGEAVVGQDRQEFTRTLSTEEAIALNSLPGRNIGVYEDSMQERMNFNVHGPAIKAHKTLADTRVVNGLDAAEQKEIAESGRDVRVKVVVGERENALDNDNSVPQDVKKMGSTGETKYKTGGQEYDSAIAAMKAAQANIEATERTVQDADYVVNGKHYEDKMGAVMAAQVSGNDGISTLGGAAGSSTSDLTIGDSPTVDAESASSTSSPSNAESTSEPAGTTSTNTESGADYQGEQADDAAVGDLKDTLSADLGGSSSSDQSSGAAQSDSSNDTGGSDTSTTGHASEQQDTAAVNSLKNTMGSTSGGSSGGSSGSSSYPGDDISLSLDDLGL